MEHNLGVPLFDRHGRQVTATVFGERLLRGARTINAELDGIERDLDAIANVVSGHLRIAFGVYPAEISGYHVVGQLAERYPKLAITAETCNWQDVNARVLEQRVDIAYANINQALLEPRLDVERATKHELAYYARPDHPLAAKAQVTATDLNQYPLVSIRVPSAFAKVIHGKASLDEVTGYLIPAIEIDDFSLARGIIRASNAIGLVSPVQISRELNARELTLLRYPRPWITPEYGFISKTGRSTSPAGIAFKKAVREAEAQAAIENAQLLDHYLPK